MRYLRKSMFFILMFSVIIITGCSFNKAFIEENNIETITPLLTIEEVEEVLNHENILIEKTKASPPFKNTEMGVKPVAYTLKEYPGNLFIYAYNSIPKAMGVYYNSDIIRSPFPGYHYNVYRAKNIILICVPKDKNDTYEHTKAHLKLNQVIYDKLNEVEELVFSGESSNWEVKTVYRQYENLWREKTGELNVETYHHQYLLVDYKKKTEENSNFDYKIIGYSSSSGSNNKPPINNLIGGGSGNVTSDTLHSITIEWNNNVEQIELLFQE